MTEDGKAVGESKIAAREGITKVVLSRMAMAAPGMVVFPYFYPNLFNIKKTH